MRTDSTLRLLAIYHDGSPLPPYPLHGPTLICIFMKPNTISPPLLPLHCLAASGKFEFEFKFEFLFILLRQDKEEGGKEGAGTATASCGRGPNCRVEWTGVEHVLCLGRGLMTSLDAGYQTEARHNPRAAARSLIWHTECSGEQREGGGGVGELRCDLWHFYTLHIFHVQFSWQFILMESPGQAGEEARSDFAPEHDRRLLAGELWASPEPQCQWELELELQLELLELLELQPDAKISGWKNC